MEMLNYALGTKKFFEGLEGELYVFKIMDNRFTSRAKDTKKEQNTYALESNSPTGLKRESIFL